MVYVVRYDLFCLGGGGGVVLWVFFSSFGIKMANKYLTNSSELFRLKISQHSGEKSAGSAFTMIGQLAD